VAVLQINVHSHYTWSLFHQHHSMNSPAYCCMCSLIPSYEIDLLLCLVHQKMQR